MIGTVVNRQSRDATMKGQRSADCEVHVGKYFEAIMSTDDNGRHSKHQDAKFFH